MKWNSLLIVVTAVVLAACAKDDNDNSVIPAVRHNANECPKSFAASQDGSVERVPNGIRVFDKGRQGIVIDGQEHIIRLGKERLIYRGGCSNGKVVLRFLEGNDKNKIVEVEFNQNGRVRERNLRDPYPVDKPVAKLPPPPAPKPAPKVEPPPPSAPTKTETQTPYEYGYM